MAITKEHIDKLIQIAERFSVSRLLLFGSAATDPENANDIDIAVDGVPGLKVFELAGCIESELRIPIDLIPIDNNSLFFCIFLKRVYI